MARPAERGFILATTLLVMTMLTVMLTAAFVMISAEYRSTNGSFSAIRSLNLAQAGLQSYLSQSHTLSSGYDSLNYGFEDGFARVVARRLRDSTASSKQLWVVYSTGVDTTANLTTRGTGTRVVAQLAYLDPGALPARAAMVAPNGVQYTASGDNPITGTGLDSLTTGCTMPSSWSDPAPHDTVGLTIVAGDSSPPSTYPSGGEGTNATELLGSATAVIDSTHIDWPKVVAGEFTPDYVSTWPAVCSGASCVHQSYWWPGDATIPAGRRRGLLVVRGDVHLASGAHWDGIILAGGNIEGDAPGSDYTIHGMVITGLNKALGESPGPNRIRRGGSRVIRWSYCYALSSTSSLSYLVPISGTFADTWKTY